MVIFIVNVVLATGNELTISNSRECQPLAPTSPDIQQIITDNSRPSRTPLTPRKMKLKQRLDLIAAQRAKMQEENSLKKKFRAYKRIIDY